MWEFIKSAPWTWAVGGLIFIGAVVGVIYGIATRGGWEDRGFMKVDGQPLRWLKENLPITALVHPELPLGWNASYQAAASRINGAVGLTLFDPMPQMPPPGYNINGPVPAGFILIWGREPAGELQVDHGHADLRWRQDDKSIYAATVSVPLEAPQRVALMLHELGHVLGLEHDDDNLGSIMYHRLSERVTPGEVTEADAARLRKAYS